MVGTAGPEQPTEFQELLNSARISLTKKISPARGSKYVGGNYAGLVGLIFLNG
jgi:hypothetical protein